MRHTAAVLNRTWLTVLGVLLVLAGAAGLLLATGRAAPLVQRTGLGWTPPQTGTRLFGDAAASAFGLVWVVLLTVVAGLVVGLLGLAWLVAQVPRKHEAKPYRLHDDVRTGLTRVAPGVLTAAVEAQAERLPGVQRASAVLRGSVGAPELTLRVSVDDRADVQQVLGQLHRQIAGDLATALDAPLHRLGVEVEVGRSRSSRARVAVQPAGARH